jgi:membrane fusion protein, copper/silver efflux system
MNINRLPPAASVAAVLSLALSTLLIAGYLLFDWNRPGAIGSRAYDEIGRFRIAVELDPEKPRIGRNRLALYLKDEPGAPVSGAEIKAVAEMPAMGAMPAMQAPVTFTETAPGTYRGEFELAMDGAWPLTVALTDADLGRAEVTYDLTTSRAGLRILSSVPGPIKKEKEVPGGREAEEKAGTIMIDARRRQLIGVTTARVEHRRLIRTIRAAARVTVDETALTDVNLKFDAWIRDLNADSIGTPVRKGQVLFTVYSPDLVSAQEEYLESLKRGRLVEAARRRLALWNIEPAQIARIAERGRALTELPIHSPVTGHVIEKQIVQGSAAKAGQPLMRIADLSRVWIEAQVYGHDSRWIRAGMDADITVPELPDRVFASTLSFVYPYLQADTRTARLRFELPNAGGLLRPDMLATVHLRIDFGDRLVVPESAVIYSGEHRYVFVDLGDGRLQPRPITTDARTDEFIEVSSGLAPGETVVTSGNFLIAAESRLKAGMQQW